MTVEKIRQKKSQKTKLELEEIRSYSRQVTVDKMSLDQMSVDKIAVDKMT